MEGLFQPLHLILIIFILLLLFGPSKFASLGKGLGEGIRNFKSSMKEGAQDAEAKKDEKSEEKKIVAAPCDSTTPLTRGRYKAPASTCRKPAPPAAPPHCCNRPQSAESSAKPCLESRTRRPYPSAHP